VPESVQPFAFFTETQLVVLTGRTASNLQQLLAHLPQVSGFCIFYHTHSLYLWHHFEKPQFYNEFANWVSQALQEERLAERLAAIDLLAITSVRDLVCDRRLRERMGENGHRHVKDYLLTMLALEHLQESVVYMQ
jgi:hypothetical protein